MKGFPEFEQFYIPSFQGSTQFEGMTDVPFSYSDFEVTREKMVEEINTRLSEKDRAFLISFKNAEPDWSLFSHEKIKDLPAVKWKLANIEKLKAQNPIKHAEQLIALEDRLKV